MATKKNLRYCQVEYNNRTYDVMVAVTDLDEVNDALQEWALEKLGATLDLPTKLLINKDAVEALTSFAVDSYVYLKGPSRSYMDMPRYVGITGNMPVLPTELVGGKYVMPATTACMYSQSSYGGYFGEYAIAEAEFTLSSGVNYIGATITALGVPQYQLYSSFSSFDFSQTFPVCTVLNFGGVISVYPFDFKSTGLPESMAKIGASDERFRIASAFTLAGVDAVAKNVQLGAITVRSGLASTLCAAVDTALVNNDMYLAYKDNSSVWQEVAVTGYDNLQYQSGSGLANLSAGEFVANNIFRVVDAGNEILFNVLSGKFSTLQEALNSGELTDLPEYITATAVLVGRIIVEQGSTTATVQKVQKTVFGVA